MKIGENISYKQSAGVKDAMFKFQACCHGYSRLLNLVLNNVGIQSINVRGHSCINGNEEGHEWNKVKIDGKWYNCDLTWDSQNMKENKCVNYCLRSDNVFLKDKNINLIQILVNDMCQIMIIIKRCTKVFSKRNGYGEVA